MERRHGDELHELVQAFATAQIPKIWNMAKGLPSVLLYALGGASGDVADEMMERIERGESVTAPQVKQYITVQKTEHVQRIVNPYYVKSPPEPPRIFNPVFGTRKPTPQITQEEIYRAGLRGGANRLIDALVHTRHDVREKAVEFVLGERQADREAFERAARSWRPRSTGPTGPAGRGTFG